MAERFTIAGLERFRDRKYKSVFWLKNPTISNQLFHHYGNGNSPFGLEIGFGNEMTRVWHIDASIPWILTEPDKKSFVACRKFINDKWDDVEKEEIPLTFRMFAVNAVADNKLIGNAAVLLIRNLDYETMGMIVPSYDELKPGQRIVFIVRNFKVRLGEIEVVRQREFLRDWGYPIDRMVLFDESESPLSQRIPPLDTQNYVLDITKL